MTHALRPKRTFLRGAGGIPVVPAGGTVTWVIGYTERGGLQHLISGCQGRLKAGRSGSLTAGPGARAAARYHDTRVQCVGIVTTPAETVPKPESGPEGQSNDWSHEGWLVGVEYTALDSPHIKPWKDCSDVEKLHGCNGLLLSPHVDHLFDRGWVSFTDEGDLIVTEGLSKGLLETWGIPTELNVGPFSEKQAEFLDYHRTHVFRTDNALSAKRRASDV